MNANDIFKDTPYLTEENYPSVLPQKIYNVTIIQERVFKAIKACAAALTKKKWNGVITGFWFIAEPAYDGGTQFMVRTSSKLSGEMVFELHGIIGDLLHHEILYRIASDNEDVLNNLPISEWLESGKIYTIFDTERTDV